MLALDLCPQKTLKRPSSLGAHRAADADATAVQLTRLGALLPGWTGPQALPFAAAFVLASNFEVQCVTVTTHPRPKELLKDRLAERDTSFCCIRMQHTYARLHIQNIRLLRILGV